MTTENHRENVDNELANYVHVVPLDEHAPVVCYGWEVVSAPHARATGFINGSHPSAGDAMAAAIRFIRSKRREIVRECEKEARLGEQYRKGDN